MWTPDLPTTCPNTGVSLLFQGMGYFHENIDKSGMTTETFLVVDTEKHMFAFLIKGESELCGVNVRVTEHPRVFVLEGTHSGWTLKNKTLDPREVNLDMHVSSRFMYSEVRTRQALHLLHQEGLFRRCTISRSILMHRLALARLLPDLIATYILEKKGLTAKISGEALYILKCDP